MIGEHLFEALVVCVQSHEKFSYMPVADTLFFAGEAVGVKGKPGNVASVHGAIESGIQAARDVIASLRN